MPNSKSNNNSNKSSLILKAMIISMLGFMPLSSFADNFIDEYEEQTEAKSFYVKGFINLYHVGKSTFSQVKERGDNINENILYKKIGLSGGLALGYQYNNISFELEGLASGQIKTQQYHEFSRYICSEGVIVGRDDFNIFWLDFIHKDEDVKYTGSPQLDFSGIYQFQGFSYMAGMVNAYYNLTLGDNTSAYIGFGVGKGKFSYKNPKHVDEFTAPVIQGKVGITTAINDSIRPYIGYRLLTFTEKDVELRTYTYLQDGCHSAFHDEHKASFKTNIYNLIHNLELGVILTF